ncbi:MAG: efflux RND transporter periplasmic adaptor subunit [Sphingomonadales bacterium]
MKMIIKKPNFKTLIKSPVGLAVIILTVIITYVTVGSFLWGGSEANGDTPGDVNNSEDELFLIRARVITASNYVEKIQVRGRTEALRTVELKAEVSGAVTATPVEKGERVKAGDVICMVEPNALEATLAQARARATQRQLEYDAAVELATKGFRSETQVASAKAERDAANAQVSRAEVDFDNTSIRAPFAGLVNDRPAELGDFLQVGNTCAVLLTDDPYLVVGEVSDNQVSRIYKGQPAVVELTNGQVLNGKVRYISNAARIETRTFRVEIEVANPDLTLKEGMTANIEIPTASAKAHFLTPSLLTLKDDGSVGIRVVKDDTVEFYPVTIAGTDPNGLWVTGLPDQIQLIITGQNFVTEGQKVRVEFESNGGNS